MGGLAMGSIAGARRTAASFTVFWAATNPSDIDGATGLLNPGLDIKPYDPQIVKAIAALPGVKDIVSESGINILPLLANGVPRPNIPEFSPGPGNGYGSVNGLFFDQDKASVLQGRLANPDDPDEFMLTAQEAHYLGVHVGDVVRFGIYTNAQIALPDFGSPRLRPHRVIEAKLVGIVVTNAALIEDQSDEQSAPDNVFTPALTRPLLNCCVNYSESGVQIYGGTRNVPAVISEIHHTMTRLLPLGAPSFEAVAPSVFPKAQRSLKPVVIALEAFGAIVALACLLISSQLVGRQIRLGADEREILRALGASPTQTWGDGLFGILSSVLLGVLLAVIVAICLSPIAPLGPVRPVYPDPGVKLDWTVLGLGGVVLIVVLSTTAGLVSYWGAPQRVGARRTGISERPSRLLAAAASVGLSAPALTGVRFALVPGSGRASVPVRSAVLGAVMAVIALVGTVTFGSSLSSLVSHPKLYGWNWDYMLAAGANLPQRQATELLDNDRYVAAWSGIYTATMAIDGQMVPVLGEAPGAAVAPPLLSGHGAETAGQVVLGSVSLAQLHEHVGGTVVVSTVGVPNVKSWKMQVVGTATLPAFGTTTPHLEMGTGAVLSYQLIPAVERNLFENPDAGPQAALVRLRAGVNRAAAYASLQKIAQETTTPENFGVGVLGVQRPAEILNYGSLGSTPAYLGAGLAAGAVAALALTLIASVRRRRRDLALLKTLGFTERQLVATVAWHSTTSVAIGVAAGVPLGIALGRWLWDLFARDISAVPAPSVPVVEVVLIAIGALVLANVVAAIPARLAARTPTALVLRAE
jgi:hypothetical protein